MSSGGGAVLDFSFTVSSADIVFLPTDAPSWTFSVKQLCWFKLSGGSSGLTSVWPTCDEEETEKNVAESKLSEYNSIHKMHSHSNGLCGDKRPCPALIT